MLFHGLRKSFNFAICEKWPDMVQALRFVPLLCRQIQTINNGSCKINLIKYSDIELNLYYEEAVLSKVLFYLGYFGFML